MTTMTNATKITHPAQSENYSKTRVGFPHSPHMKFLACCSDCADSSGPRVPAVIFPQAKQSRSTVLLDSGVLSEPPKIPLIMDHMDPILHSSLFKRSTSCAKPERVLFDENDQNENPSLSSLPTLSKQKIMVLASPENGYS